MRDEFIKNVKNIIANRAGRICSKCDQPTSGPHSNPLKAVNIGVAAHITAAAPNGSRYDPKLSDDQRSSPQNGIWLCQKCHTLIDSDSKRFPVEKLRRWKTDREKEALYLIGGGSETSLEDTRGLLKQPLLYLPEKTKEILSEILSISLYCLLIDQHCKTQSPNFGSWGKSTIDYSFMATRNLAWSFSEGSITHTAWALYALRAISSAGDPTPHSSIRAAQRRAALYVGHSLLGQAYDDEKDKPRMRHKTTSILAFEYLNPKDRENVFDSYLLTLPFLLKIISNTIHSWNNNPAEMGGDLTQLTLYIQALEATLLEKKGQLSRDVKKGISLIESSLVRLSSTVLNRGVHLGTWGDHRVLSPLLQCALMLQTVSLSRDRESLICPDLTAKIIIPYAKKLLYRLTKHTDHSSLVTQIGIIDPWTVLSFLIAFLAASKDLAEDDIDAIRCLIWKYTPKLLNSDSNVLSSSIQWSIIIIGLSGLIPWHVTNKADENSSHAVDSEFEQMCIRRGIEFVSDKTRLNVFKVWKEKFQDISEPKKSIPFMPSNRFALLNKIKFSIQNYHLNPDEFVKHTTQLYGQMITKLDPEILRLHIIIGGFSTSGKSTICQALIQSGAPVSILPRITTRTIRSDHPEIHLFKSVSRDSFNDLLERGMLVAPHELWGELYAFEKDYIEKVLTGTMLLYQVGWSVEAIKLIQEYIHSLPAMELHELFVLKPTIEILSERLKTERKRTTIEIVEDIAEAKNFYIKVEEFGSSAKLINTSKYVEESLYDILKELEKMWHK